MTSRARGVHAVHYLIASGKSARVLKKHWISQTRADNNEAQSTTHGHFRGCSFCRGKIIPPPQKKIFSYLRNSLSEYDAYCHYLKYESHPLFHMQYTYIVHGVIALIDSLD